MAGWRFVNVPHVTVPPAAFSATPYELMFKGAWESVEHTAGDPSRFESVSSQMSMTVGPDGFTWSADVWTPSPFESRYMYCAVAGVTETRRAIAMSPIDARGSFMDRSPFQQRHEMRGTGGQRGKIVISANRGMGESPPPRLSKPSAGPRRAQPQE